MFKVVLNMFHIKNEGKNLHLRKFEKLLFLGIKFVLYELWSRKIASAAFCW